MLSLGAVVGLVAVKLELAKCSPQSKSQWHTGDTDDKSKSWSVSSVEEKFRQLPEGHIEQEVVVVAVSWLFDRLDDLPVRSEWVVVLLLLVVTCVVVQSSGGPGPIPFCLVLLGNSSLVIVIQTDRSN